MVEQQRDVLAPLAQGRQLDLDRVQPEQQVLAEAAFRRRAARRAVGRGDHPDVDRHRLVGADRDHLPLLERGQQLGLEVERQIADLVEEQGAAVGRLHPPDPVAAAPVKAPFTWPNSSDSNRLSAVAPRSTETIGWSPRRDWRWISRATSSLPVPFSPRIRTLASVGAARSISEQTRSIAWRIAEQRRLAVGGRARDDAARARSAPRACVRRSAAAVRTVAASRSFAPGLGDEVGGAALDRLDRDRDAAMGGDDDHRRLRVALHDPAEIVEALAAVGRAALEIEVEQDRRRAHRALMQRRQLRRATGSVGDLAEQVAQRQPRRQRDVGIVVDDDGQVERRAPSAEPSAIVRKRTVPRADFGIWHALCNDCWHDQSGSISTFRAECRPKEPVDHCPFPDTRCPEADNEPGGVARSAAARAAPSAAARWIASSSGSRSTSAS